MKVYFYHTQDLNKIYKQWTLGRFPGHFLYGATHLPRHGVEVVMHKHKNIGSRIGLMWYVAWRVLTCREHFDAIYATRFNGLELIIFLRALHLYRKPVILWHHQPIVKADNSIREMMAQIFYRGIDHLFFFSDSLIQESLKSSKAREERMQVVHWGPDLEYYDHIMADNPVDEHIGFISTGKEKRDMPTLIRAFSATGHPLNIYIAYNACGDNYLEILNDLRPSANIHIQFINGLIPHELAQKVWAAKYVAICSQETNYTVGLTTLVEALALGLPVIATRNATYPFDIEKEGVGIVVPYYDSVAWEKAIRYITTDNTAATQMGQKARQLAEQIYNLDNCACEVAEVIKQYDKTRAKAVPQADTSRNEPETAAVQPLNDAAETPSAHTPSAHTPSAHTPSAQTATEQLLFEQPTEETLKQEEPQPAISVAPTPTEPPAEEVVESQMKHDEKPVPMSDPAHEPIINIEALKYRCRHITSTIRPVVASAKKRFPTKQQIANYLPTREELADLWSKTCQLSRRLVSKINPKK